MKKILLAGLMGFLLITGSFADELTLTVDHAVELAQQNNLSLQTSAIELRTKERTKDTAWNAFIPSIDAGAGLAYGGTLFSSPDASTFNPDPTKKRWNVNANFNMVLPINAALGTGIKQTVIDYEAGLLSYEDARKQLSRDVRQAYYGLIATAADLELKRANIEIAEKRYEQARENYNNGLISELEKLQAQVTAENNKPALNIQLTQYRNSIMNFKLLLGIPSSTEILLDGDLENITFYQFDARELFEKYSARRLDVLQINKQIESLENTRTLQSQYNRTPTLSLTSGWQTNVTDGFEGSSWKKGTWADTGSVGVQLSIPLDDFIPSSKTDVTLKELSDGIETLKINRQLIFDSAEISITNLVMNLQNSINTLETYALNVDLARKSFELTTEAYNLGTRELLDVETAQQELLTAEQNVLLEKFNYITNLLNLEYALNAENLSEILEEK